MSKDQKKTVDLPVETVENLIETFEYVITTMNFWKMNETFPCNLILKVCSDWYYKLIKTKTNITK